ncbi:DegQ family serine endoprotease [Aquibium sp. A9E412]|uniref:DegQ family serine endoprotease n=1 Tax=Aquibium sp. A9E412 TaxID=2976767 RepID=UPI0025AF1EF3|nr:DegQ family serine endoprotease [Aquibium sp. A9E412]MDN2566151.1 DegQ family serine endoprotease [Aquibium sp. A9E412]
MIPTASFGAARAALARVVLSVALAAAVAPLAAPEARAQGPASVADLAETLLDSVVNISTSSRGESGNVPLPEVPEGSPFQDFFDEFFRDRQGEPPPGGRRSQSLGSGFIIDAEQGLIVTNNHVIADADEIVVNFSDGSTLNAELVGTDPKTDIAVLQVDTAEKTLKAVPFGDSEAMRIGDWVMAIGNPFGLGGTVTVGIVSARDREIGSGPYDDYLQTDAAINRGNSGGPLFNMAGEVIGINTAIISPTGGSIGIGFSIPSELAVTVIDQLREFGETRRGWLGVRIQPVTDDIAESLGMERAMGALVSGIIEGGPIADGVIEPGDVIVEFDGTPVEAMRDLPRLVAESPVGKQVSVTIVRKGERQTVSVTLGRLEDMDQAAAEDGGEDEGAVETVSVLGMTVAALDESLRQEFDIAEDVAGVVITEVDENSAAAEKGIAAGEVIVEIAQESVSTPQQVLDRIEALRGEGRKNALLMLASRTGELRFVTLRMN